MINPPPKKKKTKQKNKKKIIISELSYSQQNVNIQDNNYKIDLSDYSSGIYILNIKTSTSTTIKKLIVK